MINQTIKLTSLALLLTFLSSCDFKPKGCLLYTGKEPVLELDVYGMHNKILYFDFLNNGGLFGKSSSSDTLNVKEYLDITPPGLLRLYLAPDSLDFKAFEEMEKPILKIVDVRGLQITGDLSNGLSLKNIKQTAEDIEIANFYKQLNKFNFEIEKMSGENFEYKSYIKTYDSINNYFKATLNKLKINTWPLIPIYCEIAANKAPLSKTFVTDNVFYFFRNQPEFEKSISDFYYYYFLKLPPFSINQEIALRDLSKQFQNDVFFKAPYPKKLRILITESFDPDKSKLEKIKKGLRERFGNDLDILIVSYKENIKQPGYFETVLKKEKRAKHYPQNQPLTTIILDANNTVLLNTIADENLELKIESILEYLEKQKSGEQEVVQD